jgi:hypothetical protein
MNVLSFNIFASRNVKNLVVMDINNILAIESEELPPIGVSVPHLQVSRSSRALNIE